MSVVVCSSDDQVSSLIQGAPASKLVAVDFTASWCGPCKMIKPIYKALASRFKHVLFLEVDVDSLQNTARAHGVTAMPTFKFFKGGVSVAEMKGANPTQLEQLITTHQGPAEDSTPALGSHADLTTFIDKKQVECLNQSDTHTVGGIFDNGPEYLESDVDEQLIIVIPFNQAVKIHSIQVIAPTEKAPKSIRTYVNRSSTLSFDEVDSVAETERLELTSDNYAAKSIIPLRFVKYQSVHSVTIFVENNLHGSDTTAIQQIILYGTPIEATKSLHTLTEMAQAAKGK